MRPSTKQPWLGRAIPAHGNAPRTRCVTTGNFGGAVRALARWNGSREKAVSNLKCNDTPPTGVACKMVWENASLGCSIGRKSRELSLGNGVPAMPRHVTLEERDRIAQLFGNGEIQAEVARQIGKDKSTVSRELKRNASDAGYLAAQAQRKSEVRRRDRPIIRKMDCPKLKLFVGQGLTQEWSPEQIEGRMEQQGADRLINDSVVAQPSRPPLRPRPRPSIRTVVPRHSPSRPTPATPRFNARRAGQIRAPRYHGPRHSTRLAWPGLRDRKWPCFADRSHAARHSVRGEWTAT